ncbi:MAG: biopolymer transporter ExbD [Gammaproteobacteria bacterium]|nr:biopolymer transporter ExbD [Gammaproteobacteria bacterium]
MARRRGPQIPPDLDITAFLNLMVILVPFLLISAVFSRVTILQLNLPSPGGAAAADEKKIALEVIVRKDRLEIGDGLQIVTRFPNSKEGEYDIAGLRNVLREIKNNFPDKLDATVLMEPELRYEAMVKVMDAVSRVEIEKPGGIIDRYELFPEISVGDAP